MPQRKMALFVEGATELIFVRRLLEVIAGRNNITFQEGAQKWSKVHYLEAEGADDRKYFALLVDCGADERVLTQILDEKESLQAKDYNLVLGLRDLHPNSRADLLDVQNAIMDQLVGYGIPVEVFVAVMEIEAWFIEEHTHFPRLDAALTADRIEADLGFNPETHVAANLERPARFLNSAYQLIGHAYTKKKWQAQATVDYLDFDEVCMELPGRVPEIERLVDTIAQALEG